MKSSNEPCLDCKKKGLYSKKIKVSKFQNISGRKDAIKVAIIENT